jgi:O-methyltransferase domain/Dimerisation domain
MAQNPADLVLQVATGYMASSALYVALHLNVPDLLADGPKTAANLAKTTGANPDALNRILRLLASIGVFEQVKPGTYGLTAGSDRLRKDAPESLRGIAYFLPDPTHFRIYANLLHSAMTGQTAGDKTVGMPLFEYFAKNPEYSEIFNDAMTSMSAPVAGAAVEAYDFSRFNKIVDVAGGHGEVLMTILKTFPNTKGVLAEIDHVVEGAKPRIASAGLADRCEAVACDFFKAVPEGGDAYVMKHIVHDWDDERASQILNNIRKAMGDKRGTVILLESVVPTGPEPDLGKFIDLEMLALPGGRERTAEEFGALFDRCGFELTKIVAMKSPLSVVEAVRK